MSNKHQDWPKVADLTLENIQAGLEDGHFTSADLGATYLSRIDEVNSEVQAITEIDPTATQQAALLDEERAAGTIRGPLHGVPLLLKNQIATANLNNTSGSTALLGARTDRDAPVVSKLRDAGAIILGTANMTQWGNNRDVDAGDGWSAHGGQVKGVYFDKQNPWGSSSGCAVGTSIGLAFAGIGTEVEGSIVCAAERINLCGLKPTAGLITRDLVILSKRIGTIGPITRCVRDSATILNALAGKCPDDPGTQTIPFEAMPGYVGFCILDGLRGARIGVPRNALKGNPPCAELIQPISDAFEVHLGVLRDLGATVIDTSFEAFDEVLVSKSPAVAKAADFKADLANYLNKLTHNPRGIHTLADVVRFTQAEPKEEYLSRPSRGFENALAAVHDRESDEYKAALRYSDWLADDGGVRGALQAHNLDALVLPTCVSPIVPALGGYPIISVPLGFLPDDWPLKWNSRNELITDGPGCPFGLSFIGDRFADRKIIQYAYAFEQRIQICKTRKPCVIPKSELQWKPRAA